MTLNLPAWKALRDAIHTTSLEVLGLPLRKHQDWFDDNNAEVQQLIREMHSAHKAWIDDKNSSTKKKAYKACKGQVQRALRKMKETWWSTQTSVLQEAFDRKDSKAFYNGIKKVLARKKMVYHQSLHRTGPS